MVYADAPNRRMGVETLLVDTPHAPVITVRIERSDHREARGVVTVKAVALPLATDADRRRLEAARQEASACLAFPDLARDNESADAFAAAASLHDENGDRLNQGLALLHAAGVRYAMLADWAGAARLAAQAVEALGAAEAMESAAFAMRVEGAALDQMAKTTAHDPGAQDATLARARRQLTAALEAFQAAGNDYQAGYALNYRGVSFHDAGDYESARADYQEALDSFRRAGDRPAQAISLQSLALLNHQSGRLADAMRDFDQALALIPREEEPENYAHTLHNSALPLRFLGRFDEAIARFYEAGQILHERGDRDGEARALHGLATTLMYAGEPERAAELLRSAIRLRGETGSRREQAISLFVLGQIEREAGHLETAIAQHQQALRLMSAPRDRAQAHLWLAKDFMTAGNVAAARRELDQILQLELPATHRHLGLALAELGDLESAAGRRDAARDYFARALRIQQANGSELDLAQTLHRRAAAMARTGDHKSALTDVNAALELFDAIGLQGLQAESRAAFRASYRDAVELRIATLLADAQSVDGRGQSAEAQRLLRLALATSDQARARLLADSLDPTSRAGVAPDELIGKRTEAYERLAGKRQQKERLLDAANPDVARVATLTREIELLRTEATLIESRIARLEAVSGQRVVTSAEELAQSAPPDVLVAEYFVGRSRGWLFEIRNGRIVVHPLPASAEIEKLARELHLAWRSPATSAHDRLAASRPLERLLFGPLADAVPSSGIQIIPDGALHLVPLALLARQAWPQLPPGSARVAPALSVMRNRSEADRSAPDWTLAVIADPIYAPDDSRIQSAVRVSAVAKHALMTRSARDLNALQRLPSTAIEARELLALVHDPSRALALVGPDANRQKVTQAPLDRYRIVHFATHAFADGMDPALATLALSQWTVDGRPQDGALRQYDITRMRLNADLVVLSGCDTALGRNIAGEGPIGLSHAFLRSGAISVVSTLWQVADRSTAELMREFYRQMLVNGRNAPVALQLAQDHVRRQTKWSDPYYWAGFQLISNARIEAGNNNVN